MISNKFTEHSQHNKLTEVHNFYDSFLVFMDWYNLFLARLRNAVLILEFGRSGRMLLPELGSNETVTFIWTDFLFFF